RKPGGGPQARLGGTFRRENVGGRFAYRGSRPAATRPVLLVDDVLTTGATAFACAEALSEAGFGPIGVVTFARTLRPLDGSPTPKEDR
ncbi:MAG: hypothetical protein R3266_08550, partial [Gemmatimonadota bacterium]|nr:hypothetical protein [Gemmatimonadota bacterium]